MTIWTPARSWRGEVTRLVEAAETAWQYGRWAGWSAPLPSLMQWVTSACC